MSRLVSFALLVVVGAAFVVGHEVRSGLGFELSPESLRAYVHGLGVAAPLLFVGLVVFRNFLLLPSMVILTVGGLAFGAELGTLLGGLGIVLSAAMKFGVARGIGRSWRRGLEQARSGGFQERVATAGPLVIGLSTAHPMGPMSPLHWAAGVSRIAWGPFLLAVLIAGPLRAGAYSIFGASLAASDSRPFYAASALLLAITLLPLAHPAVRGRILGRARSPARGARERPSSGSGPA